MTTTPDPALVERVARERWKRQHSSLRWEDAYPSDRQQMCDRVVSDVAATVAALRAAGWREATEPLPEDVEAFFDKLTGSVIDAYTLASNDDDERRDAVNRCLRRLVLADRQRAVEAERREITAALQTEYVVDAADDDVSHNLALDRCIEVIEARTRSAEKEGENDE